MQVFSHTIDFIWRLFFAELGQLTGVAAICRFPVPDDDIEYSDSDSD